MTAEEIATATNKLKEIFANKNIAPDQVQPLADAAVQRVNQLLVAGPQDGEEYLNLTDVEGAIRQVMADMGNSSGTALFGDAGDGAGSAAAEDSLVEQAAQVFGEFL